MNVIMFVIISLAFGMGITSAQTVSSPHAPAMHYPHAPQSPVATPHHAQKPKLGQDSGLLGVYLLDRFYNQQQPAQPQQKLPESSVQFTSKPRTPNYDK